MIGSQPYSISMNPTTHFQHHKNLPITTGFILQHTL